MLKGRDDLETQPISRSRPVMPNRRGAPRASFVVGWDVSCRGCCEHQGLIRNAEQEQKGRLCIVDGSGPCGPASSEVRGTLTPAHHHVQVMVSGTSHEATATKLARPSDEYKKLVGQGPPWTLILAIDSRANVIITKLLSVVMIQSHPSYLRFCRSRFSPSS